MADNILEIRHLSKSFGSARKLHLKKQMLPLQKTLPFLQILPFLRNNHKKACFA